MRGLVGPAPRSLFVPHIIHGSTMFLVYILQRSRIGTSSRPMWWGGVSDPLRGHPPCGEHELTDSVWIIPGTLKPEDC